MKGYLEFTMAHDRFVVVEDDGFPDNKILGGPFDSKEEAIQYAKDNDIELVKYPDGLND
jgi:hypothetical protein